MGGKTISTSETRIEALKLQSSAYGVTIPVVGGVTRITGNLIYQTDFKANPTTTTQGGKGGGTKVQNTTYTYTTALLMGLCHGQISGIPRIWVGKKKYSDDAGVLTVNYVEESYAVPGGGGSKTVAHAATYCANYAVGQIVTVAGEDGVVVTQYAEGIDYTVVNGVYTFPAGSPACGTTVDIAYQYTSTAGGSSALSKLGITLVPGSLSQSAPSWVTSRHSSDALAYAGLAYVSADAYSLGSGAQVENHNFEVIGPGAYSVSSIIPDIDPSTFAVKVLQDARYGAAFPSAFMDASKQWSDYCIANNLLMSPALTTQMKAAEFLSQMAMLTNTGIVWSGGLVRMVPYGDTSATGNGVTYTAPVTPIYDLTDDAYVVAKGEAPVRVRRKKQSDAYNHIRVQFRNRANDYATEIAEAKDQADIESNGLRSADIVQAEWICDANVARNVAQLMLQRSVNVRATYEFSLPWNFCTLEPMDLLTITDAGLGLEQGPGAHRQRHRKGRRAQFRGRGVCPRRRECGALRDAGRRRFLDGLQRGARSATAPTIFEAPAGLTPSGLEIYVAATGTGANWGGCRVWASMDGTNYRELGKISGGSRYGKITTTVGSTVGVLLNTGALTSGSAADSSSYSTLCYVGGACPGIPRLHDGHADGHAGIHARRPHARGLRYSPASRAHDQRCVCARRRVRGRQRPPGSVDDRQDDPRQAHELQYLRARGGVAGIGHGLHLHDHRRHDEAGAADAHGPRHDGRGVRRSPVVHEERSPQRDRIRVAHRCLRRHVRHGDGIGQAGRHVVALEHRDRWQLRDVRDGRGHVRQLLGRPRPSPSRSPLRSSARMRRVWT
jgi:hypothetical protein